MTRLKLEFGVAKLQWALFSNQRLKLVMKMLLDGQIISGINESVD